MTRGNVGARRVNPLPTISGTARFEVILEEDTHAIEMRYERVQTTDSPPLDFVIDPRIEGRGRAHLRRRSRASWNRHSLHAPDRRRLRPGP